MVESTFSEEAKMIDSFKVGPEPAETHGRLWDEECLGKLSSWGSWEFPNRIIRYVTRRSVRQENLKIRPNIVEN